MTDDTGIRDALRRALRGEPRPGLSERLDAHRLGVARGEIEPPPARVSMRTLATTLVLTAALAAGGVVVLQHRTASRLPTPPSAQASQPAVVSTSTTTDTTSSSSTTSSGTPASSTTGTSSPAPASPTPTPIPDCQAADLSGTVTTGGSSTYSVGASVPVIETFTNHANHPCQLPYWCYWEWRVSNSGGQVVGQSPAGAACAVGGPHEVVAAGGTVSSCSCESWGTKYASAGTYTVRADFNGMAVATATVTLTASTSSSSTTTTSSSSSSTPILP